ncbi:uncharacterized protein LOC119391930 [Rhipicephalus sanguineus]|uniref:uncharacterized protein LOC119391930 n=1 Tax=Rhipicephalus sanguineus TaxID=34632 RepID=UPI00189342CB|nr:uncharacterized protein LOC119391930 [Rhipicephalus sanguineus]
METVVRDRLSSYLEERHIFADSMYVFRPKKSSRDILLQLHHEILTPVEHPHNDKIILALDLKGAFDNVKHEVILAHLSATHCGERAFNYTRNFLTDRTAYIRIQDQEYGPYHLGTRGSPQGAVLWPLLFNLAMVQLPARLAAVDAVKHALYADDITLWATEGSLGDMEDSLQTAAHVVEEYAACCGLQCSPQKSEFVHIRPSPKRTSSISLSLLSGPIKEAQEIRVLGLYIHKHRRVETTLHKHRLCLYCAEVADTYHIVWAYQLNLSLPPNPNPAREDWEAALLGCQDLPAQKVMARRVRTAVTTNRVSD